MPQNVSSARQEYKRLHFTNVTNMWCRLENNGHLLVGASEAQDSTMMWLFHCKLWLLYFLEFTTFFLISSFHSVTDGVASRSWYREGREFYYISKQSLHNIQDELKITGLIHLLWKIRNNQEFCQVQLKGYSKESVWNVFTSLFAPIPCEQ